MIIYMTQFYSNGITVWQYRIKYCSSERLTFSWPCIIGAINLRNLHVSIVLGHSSLSDTLVAKGLM